MDTLTTTKFFYALPQNLDILALATNQHTGFGSMYHNLHFSREALNLDPRDASPGSFAAHHFTQRQILVQLVDKLTSFSKPSTFPGLVDFQTKTDWMNFTTHIFS